MELWDIYDGECRPTGRVHPRGAPQLPGEYHLAVTVVFVNSHREVLCTRRAPEKDLCPHMWESPGGGVQAGEDSLRAAVREIQEETGLRLKPEQLTLLYRDKRESFFMDAYGVRMDFPVEALRFQPGETDGAMWLPIGEWEGLAQAGKILTPAKGDFFQIVRDFANTLRWPLDDPSPGLRQQIQDLQALAWPEFAGAPWPSKEHVASFCLFRQGRLAAHVAVVGTEIVYKGVAYSVCGIAEVVTHPDARRDGCALRLLRLAEGHIRCRADLCLFTCQPALVPLYEKAGWQPRPGLCLVGGTQEEPFPSDSLGLATMVGLYSEKARTHQEDFTDGRVFLGLGVGELW